MFVFLIFVVIAIFIAGAVIFVLGNEDLGVILVGIAVVLGVFTSTYARAHYNERTLTCTVTDKDRGYDAASHSSNYRIYTDECGTFSNKDAWLRGKTDSADIQGQIKVGNTYKITVAGPRFGPFSWFPNILEVEPIK